MNYISINNKTTKVNIIKYIILICISKCCLSCYNGVSEQQTALFCVNSDVRISKKSPIDNWYILGAFTPRKDSLVHESVLDDIYGLSAMTNPDTLNRCWYNGTYQPRYNLLDLREIYGLASDSAHNQLNGKITYLACDIHSDKDIDRYLNVKSPLRFEQWINGNRLQRKDIQGLNFYHVHLNKGDNRYVVKAIADNDDYSYEVTVLDSNTIVQTYLNGQSNNIVLPLISPKDKTLKITNAHNNVLHTNTKLEIRDVRGRTIFSARLCNDSTSYKIPELDEGMSYMCTMTIMGNSVRQPVLCGEPDAIYESFLARRKKLACDSPRAAEIDQIMYRLGFLLKHETRETDWWWQFKIAPLTYQLELLFANPNGQHGVDKGEFNVQFITYSSELDGGAQRYLLVTPEDMKKNKKYPLVVIVRPQIEKHYHFFTSPQFTHQWAINIIQSLANSHECIVVMPEARTYLNEDLTPFAEAEMKLAIADVCKHYSIDSNKIYLHGICSGGYRALRMSTENPNMFAALGLYTPMYHMHHRTERERRHSVESMLGNIAGTPVLLFADPFDAHTPYKVYSDLIIDCKNKGVPLEFKQKRNTELLYNAVVAGEEAFDFFDGKSRTGTSKHYVEKDTSLVIADMYSKPFVYVYNSTDNSSYYQYVKKTLVDDYEEYLYCKCPLVPDNEVDNEMLATKNLFLIGDKFANDELMKLVVYAKSENPDIVDEAANVISIHRNPHNDRVFVMHQSSPSVSMLLKHPWINGMETIMKASNQHTEDQ